MADRCATKYPIVLIHGAGFRDLRWPVYWGRIPAALEAEGAQIYYGLQDCWASIETNAEQIAQRIDEILLASGAHKVNIIAHSKGGLDAKYMIQQMDMAKQVASLTTLCTPHKGSPIASFVMRFPRAAVKYAAFWVNLAYKILGDKTPDSFTACEELKRTESLEEETVNVADGVLCQSFSAAIRPGEDAADFVMTIPMMFSSFIEKGRITDGLVPRDSAIFGKYRGDCVDGSMSHTEIVDFMVRDKKRDKIFAFYSALCEELANAGL